MNFAVVNLGCKVNRVESDAAAAQLLAAGGRAVTEAEADLVVVNTCTVTGEAEKKTRKAVRRALRANGHARVVVTGCAAALDAAAYEALDAACAWFPRRAWRRPWRRFSRKGARRTRLRANTCLRLVPPTRLHAAGRVRARRVACRGSTADGGGLSHACGREVQDGCDNACTYCIVHVARGRAVSRPADQVVAECVAYARAGGARDRARRHQPGVVLRGRPPRTWRPAPARPPGTPARRDGLPAWPGRAAVPLPHLQHRAARRGRCARGRPGDGGRARVPPGAPAAASGKRRRAARHGAALPLRRLRGAGGPPARGPAPRCRFPPTSSSAFPARPAPSSKKRSTWRAAAGSAKIHVFPYSKRAGTPAAARSDQVPARRRPPAPPRCARFPTSCAPPTSPAARAPPSSRWWRKAAWP